MHPRARPRPPIATADLGVSSVATAPSPLSESLANVGRELGADRVYIFENVRGPDGRLWMNLTVEWLRDGDRGASSTLPPPSCIRTPPTSLDGSRSLGTDRC